MELKVRFDSYKILNFRVSEPQGLKSAPKKSDFKLDFKTNITANLDNNTIGIKLGVNISLKTDPPLQIGALDVEYIFKVLGLNKIEHNGKGITLPVEFLATLMSLSYSTTRGVLLAKGMGTILEKAILPIIDPHVLLPKKIVHKNSDSNKNKS